MALLVKVTYLKSVRILAEKKMKVSNSVGRKWSLSLPLLNKNTRERKENVHVGPTKNNVGSKCCKDLYVLLLQYL